MIKIIETNLSLDNNDNIVDHQSRVVEIENWNDYIEEIKKCKSVFRNSILGCFSGYTISTKQLNVKNLKYDDLHLSGDIYDSIGMNKTKKLAYKSLI